MAHARKQIRDALKTTLTGLTTTGSNVFLNRLTRIQVSELPCLLIYGDSETVQNASLGGTQERNYELMVQGVCQDLTLIEDTLDTIGKEVEVAVFATTPPGGASDIDLLDVKMTTGQAGEQPVGNVLMRFNVKYFVSRTDPETIL